MDNFNRKSNVDKEIVAIQDELKEMKSDQTDQKEFLDQNLENLNQAFNQMQDKLEELDGGQNNGAENEQLTTVTDDVDKIKESLAKVDVSKERQLQNLLQGVQNLEDANKRVSTRLDNLELI